MLWNGSSLFEISISFAVVNVSIIKPLTPVGVSLCGPNATLDKPLLQVMPIDVIFLAALSKLFLYVGNLVSARSLNRFESATENLSLYEVSTVSGPSEFRPVLLYKFISQC